MRFLASLPALFSRPLGREARDVVTAGGRGERNGGQTPAFNGPLSAGREPEGPRTSFTAAEAAAAGSSA